MLHRHYHFMLWLQKYEKNIIPQNFLYNYFVLFLYILMRVRIAVYARDARYMRSKTRYMRSKTMTLLLQIPYQVVMLILHST